MAEHVLIAGASGLVGQGALRHLREREGVAITLLSRRRPEDTVGAAFRSVDLLDPTACAAALDGVGGVTRLVYAALIEEPDLVDGWRNDRQIDANDRMFRNLMAALPPRAPGLRHVTLLQGTKAYGAHVRRMPIPAREDRDELRSQPNFYWRQEEHLRDLAAGADWSWTILRPQIVFGDTQGVAMNLIPALGVYAAIQRDLGEPFVYPGGGAAVLEAVDADLLARAIGWAGDAPAAAGEAFNVANGDVFTWLGVWPAIADALGVMPGEPSPRSLARDMPAHAARWDAIRARHGLRSGDFASFVGSGFQYADFTMGHGVPPGRTPVSLVSTVKIRQAGFGEAMDTETMFRKWIVALQDRRLLPPR